MSASNPGNDASSSSDPGDNNPADNNPSDNDPASTGSGQPDPGREADEPASDPGGARAPHGAAAPGPQGEPQSSSRGARAGRWVGAVVLMLVGLLLGVSAIAAVFARNQVLDTDRYVTTVAPLARDPVIQDAIANRLSNEILTRVDLKSLADEATAWLRQQGAPPVINQLVSPAVSATENFVRSQVSNIVHSDQFVEVWDEANRAAHNALVSVVTGERVGPVTTSGNAVTIDLGALLETIKQRLVDNGFSLASKIPDVSIPFTIFESPSIGKIQSAVRILDDVATWLPWVALVVIVAAVLAAPNRRRGIVVTGLFIAIGLLLFRGAVRLLVEYYLGQLPPAIQSPEAVQHVITTVLRNVRAAISFFALLFGLAAVFAFLFGPSRLSHAIRTLVNMLLDAIGRVLRTSGLPLGPVPAAVRRYHLVAAPVAILIALVVIFFNPSAGTVLWSTFWVLIALGIIEVVARAAPDALTPTTA